MRSVAGYCSILASVAQAPEVVGALLGLLRQCPGAAAVIPTLLEQVALSRRQRQALEGVLHTPSPPATAGGDLSIWEALQHASFGHLLEALATMPGALVPGTAPPSTALHWYTAALILAGAGLSEQATAYLTTCLQLQPHQPFAHYQLAQLLRQQQHYDTALHHMLEAWEGLQEAQVPTQVWHLEFVNRILTLLEDTQQYERFPEWLAVFDQQRAKMRLEALQNEEQQRLQEQEGAFALFQAQSLARMSPQKNAADILAQQLPFLEQAVLHGTTAVRALALQLQATALAGLQRYDLAVASYTALVQERPEDQHAQSRLIFYTALQQLAQAKDTPERLLHGLLALVFADHGESDSVPVPQTSAAALAWLQHAAPDDPRRVDTIDVLTTYAGIALQRQELASVVAVLTPLYAVAGQPRQAYYLAGAHACPQ